MLTERLVATDTAASIDRKEAERLGLALIPLHIIWPDGKQDTDFTLTPGELYLGMQKEGIPTTSEATLGDFLSFYQGLYGEGAKEIVSVHLTGLKSGTVARAEEAALEMAETHPDLKISVLDTKAVSVAELFVVLEAKKLIDKGYPLDKVGCDLSRLLPNIRLYAAIDSLTNLAKGGRISGAAALAGSVLQVKPIIKITEDGDLVISEKVRTRRKSWERMVEKLVKDAKEFGRLPKRVGIIYTQNEEVGQELLKAMQAVWESWEIEWVGNYEAGTILGVHAGAGAGGIAAQW